jgi:hypothetical protein
MLGKAVSTALLAGLLAVWASPAAAGGPFYNALSQSFCSGLPPQERTGCDGYLSYRIQRGKSRQEALERCLWACGEAFGDAAQVARCQKGCREANARDH